MATLYQDMLLYILQGSVNNSASQ